jgi:hypothetical protein
LAGCACRVSRLGQRPGRRGDGGLGHRRSCGALAADLLLAWRRRFLRLGHRSDLPAAPPVPRWPTSDTPLALDRMGRCHWVRIRRGCRAASRSEAVTGPTLHRRRAPANKPDPRRVAHGGGAVDAHWGGGGARFAHSEVPPVARDRACPDQVVPARGSRCRGRNRRRVHRSGKCGRRVSLPWSRPPSGLDRGGRFPLPPPTTSTV